MARKARRQEVRIAGRVVTGAVAAALTILVSFTAGFEGKTNHAIIPVPGDPWTICHGRTKGVKKGDKATDAQCKEWLLEDLAEANRIVDQCITAPMTIGQRAALVDFALNVGPGGKGIKDGLCWLKSGNQPYIRRMANQGRWQEACDGFLEWTRAGGVVYRGLVRRREATRALCLSDYFENVVSGVTTIPAR